jgi:hypothetical protein
VLREAGMLQAAILKPTGLSALEMLLNKGTEEPTIFLTRQAR